MLQLTKKEFHAPKKPIAYNFLDIDKIVISDKFKHSVRDFKLFIGYTDDNIIRVSCLAQMSGYIKYFDDSCLFQLNMILH